MWECCIKILNYMSHNALQNKKEKRIPCRGTRGKHVVIAQISLNQKRSDLPRVSVERQYYWSNKPVTAHQPTALASEMNNNLAGDEVG